MISTSALYKQIFADPSHKKEWKVQIGDTTYTSESIVSLECSHLLYGNQLIGNACSGSMKLVLYSEPYQWKKSTTQFISLGGVGTAHFLESTVTLYRRLRVDSDSTIVPYDSVTVPLEDAQSMVQSGYAYYITPTRLTVQLLEVYQISGSWDCRVRRVLTGGDIPVEGTFIETVSSFKVNAHPEYGVDASDGYWYTYEDRSAPAPIPKMAEIKLFVRLVEDSADGTGATSEWLEKGTYWIDTRSLNEETYELTLECVDGMAFGEQDFYPVGSTISWTNKSMREVAQMCSDKMGISLGDATQFYNSAPYVLTAPPVGYSVRQVLAGIAAAHGGNIIVTSSNQLRLVPFVPVDSGVDIGTNVASFSSSKPYGAFENVVFNFETASGETLSVRYPATEVPGETMESPLLAVTDSTYALSIAQNVLSSLEGYTYSPYSADSALVDPALEIGDGITINGLYSVIAKENEICDELYSATIGAEGYQEIKNEFVFKPGSERAIERKIAQSSASLRIDIDRIEGKVEGKITTYRQATVPTDPNAGDLWYVTAAVDSYTADTWYRYSGSAWEKTSEAISIPVAPAWEAGTEYRIGDVVDNGGKWYAAKLDHTASSFNRPPNTTYWEEKTTISQVSGTQITQAIDSITLSATSGSNSSTIKIMANGIEVDSAVVRFSNIIADSIVANSSIVAPSIVGGTFYDTDQKISISFDQTVYPVEGFDAVVIKDAATGRELTSIIAGVDRWGETISELYMAGYRVLNANTTFEFASLYNILGINTADGELRIYTTQGRYWKISGSGIYYYDNDGSTIINRCVLAN